MSEWLDLELAHRLAPVTAPEGLWERIESGRRTVRRKPGRARPARRSTVWRAWPVVALASVALAAMALWLADTRPPVLDIRQLAAAGSHGRLRPAALDLQSGDPGEIRDFLRRQANVDVPLRAAAGIRLQGARVLRGGGRPVGAVEYRVGQDSVTLLVAHADPACPLPPHGNHSAAWQARDQVFALACPNPERLEAACLLCHAL